MQDIQRPSLTSYDLLKAFAVIIMVIDHIGAYSFVESDWMRTIGRIGFPVWFFLVGYARGRDIPVKLWGSAVLLLAMNVVVGMPLFPLNALVSIILIRVTIDFFAKGALKNKIYLYGMCTALVLLSFPTNILTEYGTLGLITAMYGYYVRNKKDKEDQSFVFGFMIFSFIVFILFQQLMLGLTPEKFGFMAAGTLFVRYVLLKFDSYEYPKLTAGTPKLAYYFAKFCGHHTLEIYVVHLILFKLLALYLGYDGFSLMEIQLFEDGVFDVSSTPAGA